jgi:hypothetical protein
MREIIDQHLLDLFDGLFAAITDHLSIFLSDAQALTAIFMLLYFGIKAYGMIVADEPLQIMPLLRPFGLSMVIIFWAQFVALINYPAQYISDKSKGMFQDRIAMVDAISQERMLLIDQVAKRLIEASAEVEQVKDGSNDEDWYETLGIDFDVLFDQMKGYFIIIMSKIKFFIMQGVEFMVITCFQVCSYLVFFVQIIFGAVLVLLGPFAFAFSVLPGFKDAYIHWIARYISVSLYSTIGYIVMSLCMVVVQYGIERETELLHYILNNEAAFILYVSQNDGGANFFIVSLLLGALVMMTIPAISTWIISTSGVTYAISQMTMGARKAMMMTK